MISGRNCPARLPEPSPVDVQPPIHINDATVFVGGDDAITNDCSVYLGKLPRALRLALGTAHIFKGMIDEFRQITKFIMPTSLKFNSPLPIEIARAVCTICARQRQQSLHESLEHSAEHQ